MYSAYSKDPVVNGGLGVRKRFKDLVSRRGRRERQKTAYRRQKSEVRRLEGWKVSKKIRRRERTMGSQPKKQEKPVGGVAKKPERRMSNQRN